MTGHYPDTDVVSLGYKGARPPYDGNRALSSMYDIIFGTQPPLLGKRDVDHYHY